MKTLIGKTYEELTERFNAQPDKHFYNGDCKEDFSVFVEGNEYLFSGGRLFSIEISDFSVTQRIPEFAFPVSDCLEEALRRLDLSRFRWEICTKYSREHWVVIRLPEHDVRYEFEFEAGRFRLRFIRLECP